ncbi:MAG: glycosyltransferase family 4 protein [bacterium]
MTDKILIISPSFPPFSSGAAIYYSSILQGNKNKESIITLTTRSEKFIEPDEHILIYRVIPNFIEKNIFLRLLILPWMTLMQVSRLKIKHKITHLQAHSSTAITLGAIFASRLFNIPITYDVQDCQAPIRILKLGYQPRYLCTGNYVAELLKQKGINQTKIKIVPTLPPGILPEKPLPLKQQIFVFVGQLNIKGKGIDILLKSFGLLLHDYPQAKLWIIGQGRDRKKIVQLIYLAGIGPNITMFDNMPLDKTLDRISQASALILPSRSEAQPRVIVEAFAAGTLVIATRVGGIPELMGKSERGVLIELNDIYGLHKAMIDVLKNPEQYQSAIRAGKQYVAGLPSWSELQKQIWEFVVRNV